MSNRRIVVACPGQPGADCRYGPITMPGNRIDKVILALRNRRHCLLPNPNNDANPLVRLYELALDIPRLSQERLVGSWARTGPLSGIKQVGATVALRRWK